MCLLCSVAGAPPPQSSPLRWFRHLTGMPSPSGGFSGMSHSDPELAGGIRYLLFENIFDKK